MRNKNGIDPDTVVTSDHPYGTHHKSDFGYRMSYFFEKRSQRAMALVFALLFAGVGTYFIITSLAAPTYGPIVGIAGKCLDTANDAAVDLNKVQIWDCWGGASQQWVYNLASNGTGTIVNVNGYCLGVHSGAKAVGTLVDIYTCNGTPGQGWEVNSATGDDHKS
jgi:hypothetical protein